MQFSAEVQVQVPEDLPEEANWLIHMVNNEPTVLLLIGMGLVVWYLVRKISKLEQRVVDKDTTIHSMHSDLRRAHDSGIELDENTQFQIGIKDRGKKSRVP